MVPKISSKKESGGKKTFSLGKVIANGINAFIGLVRNILPW